MGPSDINNRGQVVGTANDLYGSNVVAFLWQNGIARSLGALPGDAVGHGNSINDSGEVVGQSCASSGFPNCRVFVWQKGVIRDLNALDVSDSNLFMVDAGKINSRGEIVGLAIQQGTGLFLAFLAVPCHDETCEAGAAEKSVGRSSEPPRVSLPENVRKLIQQRLTARRFGAVLVQQR